jgi:fimbrial chaperone protein
MKLKLFPDTAVIAVILSLSSLPTFAAGFGAGISPTKFELRAKSGDTLRDTVTILNGNQEISEYNLRTADWKLDENQSVSYFEDELLDGSCRPWVRLERELIRVGVGEQKKYRFEVHVPDDAEPGLCTFAILIEPAEAVMAAMGDNREIKFPVIGRYAVTVYVTVGDARPNIAYLGLGEQQVSNLRLPTLRLQNTGTTYDRAFGQVTATDADGQRVVLIASSFPILPGRTENILLAPQQDAGRPRPVSLAYPLKLKGRIEIGDDTVAINEQFE